ncbi:alpha-L-rhamnosidase N-terminal domain-containing protein [Gemmiger formicilis]|uniref:alpha-L-rhamnosidase-related protein n=1 Tax=Gemmiger TaxID=204475 RepID=UPI002109002F|nr:alpha-L-rhamnosidase N-terminal domain-containing protein [Gemmiger formicilis]MCQ5080701.1 alpha-L-rhamnosidase N-terminal domain-containing protein [Gemmiger formicilis]MCQ5117284.1 alpha-L-rhamnosidase N-terminal domain-containing protein [Gemmiger formicilis]
MKKALFPRGIALLLCTVSIFSLLAGCGGKVVTTPDPAESAKGDVSAPNRGIPDRSDLLYLSAIEGYKKTDWTANWIWTESCAEDSYVAFRKTFTLEQAVPTATAFISAADKYVLWVNGELVVLDGSLKRGPTPYDSYYDTVELTNLKQGENTIALLVAFNGRSGDGSIVPVLVDEEGDEYTQAGLIFELDAGGTTICSDSSWKAARHTGYKNRVTAGADYPGYSQSSMLAERNVYFDARDDLGDFMAEGYNDSEWEDATPVSKAGDLPFGDLYSAMIQPIRFQDIVDFSNSASYVGTPLTQDTTLVLDLPGNIQFTPYFELEAPAGKKLTFYTDTYTDKQELPNFKDTYVTAEGTQRYENYPWRSGSKLIIEAEAGVTFTRLGYRASGFNGEQVGSFTSSDPGLDQLWQESLNTLAICMRDTYMDCPERERGPYMGDASNEIDAALYSYDQGGLDLTKKAILACVAWTRTDGAIPSRAPSVKPQEIPNQSLIFMTSVYHYWLHSGDRETAEAYCNAFLNYLRLVEMENGLPVYRDGSWTWDDWGDRIDTQLLQTGIYYYALNVTKSLADDLGITEGTEFLAERMDSMRENWRAVYYTEEGFKSPDSKYVDDRANAMLALSGLAGEKDWPLITDVIMSTYQASPFIEKYVLEALCVMGRIDLALQRMRDRYAPMLNDEYDTLWETFDGETGTVNHGWTAAPLYILSKYAAGIRPTQAGFEAYEIAPGNELDSFHCTVWTPKGEITAELETAAAEKTLTVTAIDAAGTILVPEGMGTDLIVSGGDCEIDGNRISVAQAGKYVITIH